MHIVIRNLHKAGARFSKQFTCKHKAIAQVREIAVDTQFPGIPEGLDHLWLTRERLVIVLDIAVVEFHLPVGAILDAVGRVDIDHLHPAGHSLPLQQGVHHQKGIALNQPVAPVGIVFIILGHSVKFILILCFRHLVAKKRS